MKKTLKSTVENMLKNCEKCRNDDVHLTTHIWYASNNLEEIGGEWYVNIKKLKTLPREDHVKRIRATIQNEDNKYLPTSAEVRRKRRINEDLWRTQLGYKEKYYG